MNEQGYRFHAYPCDVTDWVSCQACIRKMTGDLDRVNVLVGKPEEAGGLVAYLTSEEAAYVTGPNIAINGGQHMQ